VPKTATFANIRQIRRIPAKTVQTVDFCDFR